MLTPSLSFMTCGCLVVLTSATIFMKCGGKTCSNGQKRYIQKTDLELTCRNLVLFKFLSNCHILRFHLTIDDHLHLIARPCDLELRPVGSIYRFVTNTATATHIFVFVLSRIDYCNTLLFGFIHNVTYHFKRT